MRNLINLLTRRDNRSGGEVFSESEIPPYHLGKLAEEQGDIPAAIMHYRAALARKPGDNVARSALGRLQFVPPPQPFVEKFRSVADKKLCEVTVQVRNPCNYRCDYCVGFGENNLKVERFDLEKIDEAFSKIEADLIVTALECGGGEPTVHPQFADLVRILTKYGVVSFPTNNSQNPRRWLPKDMAHRLLIRAALHPEGEEKLEQYIDNAKYLIDAGARFVGIFICHPTRLERLHDYKARFAAAGVPFTPTNFLGEYEGKRYPGAYTAEERALLEYDAIASVKHVLLAEPEMTRIRDFSGIPCHAGSQSLYISNQGVMRRCLWDARPLESQLDGPTPCRTRHCGCGVTLKGLAALELPDYQNDWARMLGKNDLVDLGWAEGEARAMGHEDAAHAVASDLIAYYNTLMDAYEKFDSPPLKSAKAE